MAFASDTSELIPPRLTPEALFKAPIGFVSPLWGMFSGAALTGVAWWWATQWMRSPLMAAALARTEDAAAEIAPALEAVTAQVEDAAEPVVAAAQAQVERAVEAAEPIVAAIEETPEALVAANAALVEPTVAVIEDAAEAVVAETEGVAEAVLTADLPDVVVGGESAPVPPVAVASTPKKATSTPRSKSKAS